MDYNSVFDTPTQPQTALSLLKELNLISISDLFPPSGSFSSIHDFPSSWSPFQNDSLILNSTFSQKFRSSLPLANSSFIDPIPSPIGASSNALPGTRNESSSPLTSLWPLAPSNNTKAAVSASIGPELRFEWRLGGPDVFVKPVGLVVFRLKPEGSERFTDPLLLVADMHRNTIVLINLAGKHFLTMITEIDPFNHGRPVCRARGVKCSPRFCEANVKSLILTIGASPDLDCAPPSFINSPHPSFHSHWAPMLLIFHS